MFVPVFIKLQGSVSITPWLQFVWQNHVGLMRRVQQNSNPSIFWIDLRSVEINSTNFYCIYCLFYNKIIIFFHVHDRGEGMVISDPRGLLVQMGRVRLKRCVHRSWLSDYIRGGEERWSLDAVLVGVGGVCVERAARDSSSHV